MLRTVKVYFESEDAAESAYASLQRMKVHNIFIDSMMSDKETNMTIPFFPTAINDLGAVTNMKSESPHVVGAVDNNVDKKKKIKLTHLLQFDIEEDEYEQALSILKEHEPFYIEE